MKNTLLILGVMIVTILGCAGEDKEAESDSTPQTEKSSTEQTATNSDANTIENLPWTFLVNGVYHNNATIGAGSDAKSNVKEGHWIDFKENGTYMYGVWDKRLYHGDWFYDDDTTILDLMPDDEGDEKPSQWKVMHKDDNLIWMGTSKYGNNSTQIQWLRREGFPQKQD